MILIRTHRSPDITIGYLYVDGLILRTIEPPWKNNERNKSRIRAGCYDYELLPRSYSGKYRNCYLLRDVRGRSEIMIHNGNLVDHTRGCIIVGERLGWLGGRRAVLNSKSAIAELNRVAPTRGKIWVI
jgi:hypothetical protein